MQITTLEIKNFYDLILINEIDNYEHGCDEFFK